MFTTEVTCLRLVHSPAIVPNSWFIPAPGASQYGENLRARFLTQASSTTMPSMRGAVPRAEDPWLSLSSFSQSNISMFARRRRARRREAAAAKPPPHGAGPRDSWRRLKAGDHVVARGDVRFLPLRVEDLLRRRYGIQSDAVGRLDSPSGRGDAADTKSCFLETRTNPTLDVIDISAYRRDRAPGRAHG